MENLNQLAMTNPLIRGSAERFDMWAWRSAGLVRRNAELAGWRSFIQSIKTGPQGHGVLLQTPRLCLWEVPPVYEPRAVQRVPELGRRIARFPPEIARFWTGLQCVRTCGLSTPNRGSPETRPENWC